MVNPLFENEENKIFSIIPRKRKREKPPHQKKWELI